MNFPFRVAGRYVTASFYEQDHHEAVQGEYKVIYVTGYADKVSRTHAKAIAFMLDNNVKSLVMDGVNICQHE